MRSLLFLMTVIILGCTPAVTINEQAVSDQLQFLRYGRTTADDVVSMFGVPHYEYENGRIIVYSMCSGKDGQLERISGLGDQTRCGSDGIYEDKYVGMVRKASLDEVVAIYNLILVFDTWDLLCEYDLLRIR